MTSTAPIDIDAVARSNRSSDRMPATPRSEHASNIGLPLLLTLALLSAIAPFATDLYLPAFPAMVSELSTAATGVQFSLTAFLIGAGVGQIIFGPISDRIGRKAPLLVGTVLFVAASIGAALAPTIGLLIALRLAQGLFGAAGMVIGRAIISDQAHGQAAARAFGLMMLVGGIAPIIAPFLGSTLADSIGWRGLLWIVVGIGAVAVIAVAAFVRETRAAGPSLAPAAPHTGKPQKASLRDLGSRLFLANAVAYAFAFATMMAYISASPFLYQDMMGLTTVQYGLAFALNAIALAVVSSITVKLSYRFSIRKLTSVGFGLNLASVATLGLLVAIDVPVLWLALPILVAVGSLGLILGNTTALALEYVPKRASGSASAVLGFLQFLLAGIVSPLVSIGGENSAAPLALVMVAASLIATLAFTLGRVDRSMASKLAASLAD